MLLLLLAKVLLPLLESIVDLATMLLLTLAVAAVAAAAAGVESTAVVEEHAAVQNESRAVLWSAGSGSINSCDFIASAKLMVMGGGGGRQICSHCSCSCFNRCCVHNTVGLEDFSFSLSLSLSSLSQLSELPLLAMQLLRAPSDSRLAGSRVADDDDDVPNVLLLSTSTNSLSFSLLSLFSYVSRGLARAVRQRGGTQRKKERKKEEEGMAWQGRGGDGRSNESN